MKYKTLFRLLIRCAGAYFAINGGAQLVEASVVLGMEWLRTGTGLSVFSWYYQSLAWAIVRLLVGIALYFRPGILLNRLIPSNRNYCHECGYELRGAGPEGMCPECGTEYVFRAPRPRN